MRKRLLLWWRKRSGLSAYAVMVDSSPLSKEVIRDWHNACVDKFEFAEALNRHTINTWQCVYLEKEGDVYTVWVRLVETKPLPSMERN